MNGEKRNCGDLLECVLRNYGIVFSPHNSGSKKSGNRQNKAVTCMLAKPLVPPRLKQAQYKISLVADAKIRLPVYTCMAYTLVRCEGRHSKH